MPTTRSQGIATIEPAKGGGFLICLPDGPVEHRGLPFVGGAIFITILILSSGDI
jgi:hypothetical protein